MIVTPPLHLKTPSLACELVAAAPRAVDLPRAERAVRELLLALGEDPTRDGLRETPSRVARAFAEMTAGLREDPGEHLARVFAEDTDDLVVVNDIAFHALCEHHLLPFSGRASIAYLPAGGRIVGLSKLARTVEVFARRPQVQERLTAQIADAIVEHLEPEAVGVLITSEHACMQVRGVRQAEAAMTTTAWRGRWKFDSARRAEVAPLLGRSR